MFNKIKELVKHSIVYGTANIFNRATAIILIPIYTRYLGPGDYGVLEIFTVSLSFVFMIMQLGMGTALFRSFIYKENISAKVIISSSFYFLTSVSLLLLIILWVFSDMLSTTIFKSTGYTNLLRLVFLSAFLNNIGTIALAKLRIDNASLTYSIIVMFKFLLQLLLSVYLVVGLKRGVEGVIVAGVIAAGISAVIFICVLIKDMGFVFYKKEIIDMLGFGLPLVPTAIAASLLAMTDRFLLKFYGTPAVLGVYSLGYKLGMIIVLITEAFQTAWPTVMFSIAKDKRANLFYSRVLTYFCYVITFVVLGLSIFSREILQIFATAEFYEAHRIIPIIAISYALFGGYYVTAVGVNLRKKTQYQAIVVILGALINIILNLILIRPYGMIGAAFAALISYFFIFITATRISQYFYPINYEKIRILKIIAAGFILYYLSSLVNFSHVWAIIIAKLLLLFSYFFILYVARFYEKDELNTLKALWQKQKI